MGVNHYEAFRDRLNEAIRKMGTNNAALSKLTGTSPSSVALWRKGKCLPDGWNIISLCEALGVSADWLLGIEQPKPKRQPRRKKLPQE